MLITPHQLYQESQGAAPPLLLDVRPAEEFAAGHLPGALHLDLWGISLIDTSDAPLRAFMWMVGHLFSLRGVTPDRPVVVYEKPAPTGLSMKLVGLPKSFAIRSPFGNCA